MKYRNQGLVVVGINPGGYAGVHPFATDGTREDIGGIQGYIQNLKVTYPVGLEMPSTPNYVQFSHVFKGINPFPIDIVVGKDGKIAYIAREYDPVSMAAVIEAELAK
ncbi:MAG: hypothetical protein ACE14L_08645 [Terriglobales bacterium]